MSFRLLPPYSTDLPSVPAMGGLRPGDRLEPVQLSAEAGALAQSAAAEFGVTVDLAVALLVEATLVLDWLAEVAVTIDELADPPAPAVLSAAEADYLRGLTVGRRRGRRSRVSQATTVLVTVPVRLLARASPALVDRACAGDLAVALAWEVEAMRAGMGMAESVMRQAGAALMRRPDA